MTTKKRPSYSDLLHASRTIAEDIALSELSPESVLHKAITYHFNTPGSEARAALCISSSLALGLAVESAVRLAAAVETLHNASLIQDDLQDQDDVRRGHPAVWKKFGKDTAINATDLLIASSFALVSSVGSTNTHRLVASMTRAIAQTLQGQARDLNTNRVPNIDDAIAVAKEKSGPLFSLSLELPLVLSGHLYFVGAAREAGAAFGIGYQIFDDINDCARDREAGSLSNMALLIETSKSSQFLAIESAEDLAHYFLDQAASNASALPNNSGAMLADKCVELLSELDREAA